MNWIGGLMTTVGLIVAVMTWWLLDRGQAGNPAPHGGSHHHAATDTYQQDAIVSHQHEHGKVQQLEREPEHQHHQHAR